LAKFFFRLSFALWHSASSTLEPSGRRDCAKTRLCIRHLFGVRIDVDASSLVPSWYWGLGQRVELAHGRELCPDCEGKGLQSSS